MPTLTDARTYPRAITLEGNTWAATGSSWYPVSLRATTVPKGLSIGTKHKRRPEGERWSTRRRSLGTEGPASSWPYVTFEPGPYRSSPNR